MNRFKVTASFIAAIFILSSHAGAQPFSVGSSQIQIVVAPPINHAPIHVPVTAASGFDFAALHVTSDASWVTAAVAAPKHEIVLTFKTSSLVNSSYTATITATQGTDKVTFFVKAAVSLLNVTKMIDDPFRSRVYAVHQNGTAAGAVVIYDPLAKKYVGSITGGRKPTDLAVTKDGTELLVINSVDHSITVIDLTSLSVKQTIPLTAFENWGDPDTSANIKVGPGNIIYYSDGAWAPNLRVFDRSSRKVLQTVLIGDNGFGDFALTSDYKTLIGWAQYGWTAGWAGCYVAKFSVAPSGLLTAGETTDPNYPTTLTRDPLDTPVLISNDNALAFVKGLAVKTGAIKETQQTFPTDVYSISPGGEVAATKDAIVETATGNKLLDLPVATPVQTITSDYARLVYFDQTNRSFGTINLLDAIGDKILNRTLYPPNGSIVLSPENLRWQSVPGAQTYRVYLGTNAAAVGAAEQGSPLLLGVATSPMWPLSNKLAPGSSYFWRIDTVSSFGVTRGQVYKFTVSEISASISEIVTATVQGHAHHVVSLDLASDAPGKTWHASSAAPWISFEQNSGTTPSTLRVIFNASHLAPGNYSAAISISGSAGDPFAIPVKLKVDALHLTILKSDRQSSIVYGISEGTDVTSTGAYLLEINTTSEAIERVVPVGTSVTDLALHTADNRIYVPNWKDGRLLAIDRTSFAKVRTYNFSPFGGVGYSSNDVFRVTPGAAGRLIIEPNDQWINISLFNTVAGTVLANTSQREGGGAADPTGRFYYHGDNNISDAQLRKFDLTGDKFTAGKSVRINPLDYYGSRVVISSEDGTHLFWNGMVFDPNLTPLRNLAAMIYATTKNGRFAFGESDIYDTETGQIVFGMPATTTVSAFNSTTSKLVAQVDGAVRCFAFAMPVVLPAPVLTIASNPDGTVVLTWTDKSLETGFTIQRRVVGTTDWEDVDAAVARNTTSVTLTNLHPGTSYEFRIKADTPVASSNWSTVETITVPIPPRGGLANISSRLVVGAGDNPMIGGFIITGSEPKKVMIRGLGPALTKQGIEGALANPTLTLNKPDGTTVFNDDWADSQQQEIEATTIPPENPSEAAIVAALPPGAYTVLLRGKNDTTGMGLLELYDLDFNAASVLANLSTRGSVLGGDNVLIGGIITGGTKAATVVIRGIGPSLSAQNVSDALQDPELELFDKNGTKLLSNDDWQQSDQADAIYATGVAPWDPREAAILATLAPDAYTAVLRGKSDSTGTAVVEVYHLQ